MLVATQIVLTLVTAPRLPALFHAQSSALQYARSPLLAIESDLQPMADTAITEQPTMSPKAARLSPITVLWRFSRPHTLIGSALCIPALTLYAAPAGTALLSGPLVLAMIYALPPALLMNLYVTGLNQLTDIELDKVNKPTLPLAAGSLSPRAGVAIVVAALVASLALGWLHPLLGTWPLRVTLAGSAVLGTLYSLPPFRLKRFPLLAAFSIMAVRGALVNWGFSAHALAVLAATSTAGATGASSAAAAVATTTTSAAAAAATATMPLRCFLPVGFFVVFGSVIALIKDVPDVKGDAQFGYRSFSVRMGPAAVLSFAVGLLVANFAAAATLLAASALFAVSSATPLAAARRALVAAAVVYNGWLVLAKAKPVVATDAPSVYSYYMDLWKTFYASYALLPFAR
jgi:homogentisate phytyltransferase/homogentisate geranylgeranyltransferase